VHGSRRPQEQSRTRLQRATPQQPLHSRRSRVGYLAALAKRTTARIHQGGAH
jgi:hypothetical protein